MGYEELVRSSWRKGDYVVDYLAQAAAGIAGKTLFGGRFKPTRELVRGQMEALAGRDAGDARACLNGHKEGIMKLVPFVKFREEKFGAVLFETRSEKVYTLSPTGAAVVREIVAGVESARLGERLREKYEDPGGRMVQEAEAFLSQLKDKGLITE